MARPSLEDGLRAWWEQTHRRPSRGEPLFEGVPLVAHLEDLYVALLRAGKPLPGGAGDADDPMLKALRAANETGDDPFADWKPS